MLAAESPVLPASFEEIVDPVEMPVEAVADPCTPDPDSPLHCTTIASRTIPRIGRVDIRKASADHAPGYMVDIVIVTEHDGMFVIPMITFGQNGDLTKTNDATRGLSTDIRALQRGAVGIALDYTGELSPNWKDTFKAHTWHGSILIACQLEDGALACKAIQLGGAFGDCHATDWHGLDAQIRCDRTVRL